MIDAKFCEATFLRQTYGCQREKGQWVTLSGEREMNHLPANFFPALVLSGHRCTNRIAVSCPIVGLPARCTCTYDFCSCRPRSRKACASTYARSARVMDLVVIARDTARSAGLPALIFINHSLWYDRPRTILHTGNPRGSRETIEGIPNEPNVARRPRFVRRSRDHLAEYDGNCEQH
jgi:hypothetical protein